MKKFTVRFEEVIGDYREIPQLPVVIIDTDTHEEITRGYMAPFRRYCFQISADTEGNCDMGSSNTINLSQLFPFDSGLRKELIKGQIALCVESYLNRAYSRFEIEREYQPGEYIIEHPNYNPPCYGVTNDSYNNYNEFIKKCDDWLFS